MNKSELLQLGQHKIKEGKTRQAIFEELKTEADLPTKELAEIMRQLPPTKTKEKFKVLSYMLVGLLAMIVVIRIGRTIVIDLDWLTMSMIVSAINLMLIVALIKFNVNSFRLVAIVSGVSLYSGFPGVFKAPLDYSYVTLFVVTVSSIVLSYYLYKKLAPGYETKRELYTNDFGELRGQDVIYFKD